MDRILQLTEYAAGYQFPDPTAYSNDGVRGKGMVRKRSHSGTISGQNRVFLDPFETSDPSAYSNDGVRGRVWHFRGSAFPDICAKVGLGSQHGMQGQVLGGGTGDRWGDSKE